MSSSFTRQLAQPNSHQHKVGQGLGGTGGGWAELSRGYRASFWEDNILKTDSVALVTVSVTKHPNQSKVEKEVYISLQFREERTETTEWWGQ